MFPIYVGWDSRQAIAFDVCKRSILARASIPVEVIPIRQDDMRACGFYYRAADPLASTEFTYTRFLVPWLMGYRGWALFCDCDFLFQADVADLIKHVDDRYAVMCVKHDHRPDATNKMAGKVQTAYPRKNWSSLVLYNCGHPVNSLLTLETVNRATGAYLHQFKWLDDDLIGEIPEEWNWLAGVSPTTTRGEWMMEPRAVHFTDGTPMTPGYGACQYADRWWSELSSIRGENAGETARHSTAV